MGLDIYSMTAVHLDRPESPAHDFALFLRELAPCYGEGEALGQFDRQELVNWLEEWVGHYVEGHVEPDKSAAAISTVRQQVLGWLATLPFDEHDSVTLYFNS